MDVLHVLLEVRGTSIPLEIASSLDSLTDVNARVVSKKEVSGEIPDTVDEDQILREKSGFADYGDLLEAIADEYDFIHTHHVGPAAKAGFHSRRLPIHHVNTQHGHAHYTPEEKLKNIPGILFADTIVYNSRYTSDSYNLLESACKFNAEEYIVHNGVNTEAITSHRADIDDPTTVVTAARLIPRKNIETLIRALNHIEGPLSLQVIGDGPHRETLEEVARNEGLHEEVEFLGYLPDRNDVYEAFSDADIFAMPSHGEGFCVAVAEAMAVGLPVVVSDIEIFHEVVGDSGIFIDRNSPEAIGASLSRLRENPDQARTLGRQNRDRILDHFTLERCARGYENVYAQVSDER